MGTFTGSHRLKKEMENFRRNPPHGISCYSTAEHPLRLAATIIGPEQTPYAGGFFHLTIEIPDNYPFAPPQVRFLTPIIHPNIDEKGRICLDLLRPMPTGSWRCTHSIANILIAIQCLMAAPNPNDPLCPEIASMFLNDREQYDRKAHEGTVEHAQSQTPPKEMETVNVVTGSESNLET